MIDLIPFPQPPLTPEQIAIGKDVEIRRLMAQIETLTTVSQQYVDKLETARTMVKAGSTAVNNLLATVKFVEGENEKLRASLTALTQAHQQAVNENREWIDKWDAHDHYPHGYVHAQIGLRERTEAQFQAETLRTSMLAQLLLEFAKIYSVDHFQEAWPKACHRCDLLKDTKQALDLPVNTAWDDHLTLKAQLQQAVEALKAWEHWYDQDASEFNRDTARAMGVKVLATHKEQG